THGLLRRSAASASRAWVNSFSFTRSFWCAASHSFADTILGGFIWSFFFSTPFFILVLLSLYLFVAPVKTPKYEHGRSSAGRRASGHESNVSDACGTHVGFLSLRFPFLRWPVLLFQIFGQAIKRSLPKLAICLHPLGSLSQRFGIEPHFMNASIAPAPKQAGLLKYPQVFRDSGK